MDTEIIVKHKDDLERMLLDGSAEPTYLPLSLLEDITNCFSDAQRIGSGGFAVVYKGIVGEGIVAVKKLSQPYGMHEDKFLKEVECMVKAKHKNIVRFLGYCYDTQGRLANYEGKLVMADLRNWLLCFEYVPNGSLDMYITGNNHNIYFGIYFLYQMSLHRTRVPHKEYKEYCKATSGASVIKKACPI
ncbi:cysteine-rich receptor-like protein kinase 10 [Triticum dicoccoides]|uniref:cysteine-rich receptor-like protein kinase 10 n=1 Tax=Triticum dicoccoides TaxID=85692 RepID=UPI001890C6BF|nr:cysteine-rich receptor-like protein kinase 10 [Triticum dicoccoides]